MRFPVIFDSESLLKGALRENTVLEINGHACAQTLEDGKSRHIYDDCNFTYIREFLVDAQDRGILKRSFHRVETDNGYSVVVTHPDCV